MVPSKHVMIVDDTEGMRDLWATFLSRGGYSVTAFSGPDDVLAAVAQGAKVDLLVTDFDMNAALDGTGLAAALRRQGATFPILLVSGLPRKPHPALTAIMLKDGDMDRFLAKVAELLGEQAA